MNDRRLGGRFSLERELGSGGMSTVYLGTDEVLDRVVAVKVLKSEFMGSDIGDRFRREGRTAARLSHPNIVQVYDAGDDDLDGEQVFYIVMEHVSGGDLRGLIHERGTLSAAEISDLSGVAAGLAHAHERGIIHRDVKPHNILLDENGQPKLADFGIARALDATQMTQTGMYMGTARYSSPEQLQGEETTPKSDIYSLGATLYEAATGDPPFSGTPIEVASQHVSKPPTPPGELALVDDGLEALILACLSKDPGDRPDATQVRNRLAGSGPSAPETPAYAASPAPEPTGPTASTASTTAATSRAATPAGSDTTGRSRTARQVPLLVALVAVLALLGTLGVFSLLGDGGQQAQGPVSTTQVQPSEPTTAGQSPQETVEAQRPVSQPGGAEPTTSGPVAQEPEDDAPGPAPSQGISDEQAAARTVRNIYELAEDENYERSYDLISARYKQSTFTSQAEWRGTFSTLQSISFLEGPNAQVTGDTAQVTGVTRAVHTDRTERNTAEWTLIRENGEWKLDSIAVETEVIST